MLSGRRIIVVWAFVALALSLAAASVHAAGGAGHYFIAKRSAERIIAMPGSDELEILLRDTSCLNAFCNGSIAPDLPCIVSQAHYGRITKLPMTMVDIHPKVNARVGDVYDQYQLRCQVEAVPDWE